MRRMSEQQELAERWRIAGLLLRRIDPVAFDALMMAAEVFIVETPEVSAEINFVDLVS